MLAAVEIYHQICDISMLLEHFSDLKSVKFWPQTTSPSPGGPPSYAANADDDDGARWHGDGGGGRQDLPACIGSGGVIISDVMPE